MLADSKALGDNGTTSNGAFSPDWIPAFKQAIDGLILIAGDSHLTVIEKLAEVKLVFSVGAHNAAIHEVTRIIGDTRPGNEKGHEHFGFLDGISQPAVQGVDTSPNPGQETVPQGTILLGRQGDVVTTRPSWALDGSFLAFRYLFQLVPEFDKFTKENPIPGLPAGQGSDLLGARLVGRWKSGAPVDLSPIKDDPTLGRESSRNNNFSYSFPDDSQTQDRCPFAAHTRKTNPRADLPAGATTPHRIIRRGLQFGPEVSAAEIAAQKTIYGRGLLFAAYQSSLAQGFQFIQKSKFSFSHENDFGSLINNRVGWANNTGFPINKPIAPGFDAIIGQAPDAGPRTLSGTNPNSQSTELALNADWVVPKGGEYFFSPSIPALKGTFAVSS
ncbi:hypothetical protein MMC14_008814 [Varicellaria rhodocarpa]|nr:hypothetical protein [Varicellaria rhodocarpa]